MKYTIEAIDHVLLAAPEGSEKEAVRFYGEVLGFREEEKPDSLKGNGGVWFSAGNIQLHIGIEAPFYPAKKAHPAFEVKRLEQLKEHLRSNGIELVEDDKLPGANRFYVYDPFGNRLEFLEWIR